MTTSVTIASDNLPLLDLAGPPRELGRAHGEAARDRIAHNVELYFRRFLVEGGVDRAEAMARGAQYLAVIDRSAPDYGEMVRGLAEASGLHLHEIAALNARYEILYSEFSRNVMELAEAAGGAAPAGGHPGLRPAGGAAAGGGAPGECTAFAALPEATADGHLRIGQTWDWIADVAGVLLRIRRDDGLQILCFTEAGIAGGKIGLNSAGLGLVINGLVSSRDSWARLRTPFHVRTWRVLNSRTLEEAQAAVLGEERSCSANFLLGQALPGGGARVVNLETAPLTAATLEPTGGILAHANHFVDPDRLDVWQPIDERSSTYQRCRRMQALLERERGRLDDARLMAILSDHDGMPLGICTHPSPLWPEEERYGTVFAAVLDLTARELLACPGTPCTVPFRRVPLAA